jgi:hypothetical protein
MTADQQGYGAPIMPARSSAIAEVGNLRHRELITIAKRLGRLSMWRWDRWFAGAGLLLAGAAMGGGFALIPFLGASPSPSNESATLYISLLGTAVLLTIACGVASLAVGSEREDSVAAIKEDLDSLLSAYEVADDT